MLQARRTSQERKMNFRNPVSAVKGGIWKGVLFALFGLLLLLLPPQAWAQVGGLYWQCVAPSSSNPQGTFCPVSSSYPLPTNVAPTSSSTSGIPSTVSSSGVNSLVLKGGAGNLYGVYASNLTATGGFLLVLNAVSAPVDGAVVPLDCVPLPANGAVSINFRSGPPKVYTTGITAVVSSAATCFTKTTGVITAFISGDAQ